MLTSDVGDPPAAGVLVAALDTVVAGCLARAGTRRRRDGFGAKRDRAGFGNTVE